MRPGSQWARCASGGSLLSSKSTACVVDLQSLSCWTTKICMLGWVVDAAGVFFVRRETDAAVSMKKV
jgi:hypothetical protein